MHIILQNCLYHVSFLGLLLYLIFIRGIFFGVKFCYYEIND